MKYTRNIPLKLKLMGFYLADEVKDEECHYEDWRKAPLMVCVDHTMKTVIVELDQGYQGRKVNVKTIKELESITEILNR